MFLQLQNRHLKLLKIETKKLYPVEACAILFGHLYSNQAIVEKVEIVPNKLQSNKRFEVDPGIVISAFTNADQENMAFIGLFHSHPAPAFPSQVDLTFMKLWGDAIWLILSSTDGNLAAYKLKVGVLIEVTISIN